MTGRRAVSWTVTGAAIGAVVIMAGGRASRASDHEDGPSVLIDPAADITDVFAFVKPVAADGGGFAPSDRLVAAMTVYPSAAATARFDPTVDYQLNFTASASDATKGVLAPYKLDVTLGCHFSDANDAGHQPFVCACNGHFFSGETDTVSGDDAALLRVFAGRRADPGFGAIGAAAAAIEAGTRPGAGANELAGKNVLAIVAELDVRVIFGDGGRPLLAVSASTGRGL